MIEQRGEVRSCHGRHMHACREKELTIEGTKMPPMSLPRVLGQAPCVRVDVVALFCLVISTGGLHGRITAIWIGTD